jgi:membrane dipeptidase
MRAIFDGHNDSVQRLQEYRPDGVDFFACSTDGHLDLPRAMDGGLVGGLFAMFVRPEHPPVNDLTVRKSSYEVRLAEPLDPAYARRKTRELLTALKRRSANELTAKERSAEQRRAQTAKANAARRKPDSDSVISN